MLEDILQVVSSGLVVGSFFALVAAAMQVTYGATRVLNFAQGEFVVFGMFAMWFLVGELKVPLVLGFLLLIPIGAIFGTAFGGIIVAPVATRSLLSAGLATLAGSIILRALFVLAFGLSYKLLPSFAPRDVIQSILGDHAPRIISGQGLLVIGGAAVVIGAVYLLLRLTSWGLTLRATADDREGALAVGVRPRNVLYGSFALSGAISAIAGGLMVSTLGVRFDSGSTLVISAFVAAILGGLSSMAGAALGGVVVGLLTSVVSASGQSSLTNTWLFVAMLVLILVRPNGVFGKLVWE